MTKLATVAPVSQNGQTWIPEAAIHYLTHTEMGRSIRDIARDAGCHASTILRRVRRFENRRDDPLVDGALERMGAANSSTSNSLIERKEPPQMSATLQAQFTHTTSVSLSGDALRVLRRLAETGAVLAVAKEMEKAVVVRELPGGKSTRTTVVDREVAEVMALNEWISCSEQGRISRYTITSLGRSALKRMLAEEDGQDGLHEAAGTYDTGSREWGEKEVLDPTNNQVRRVKYNIAESPLTALARRRDKSGTPFLSDELVAAGERLREDFELAQMGPRVTQNWERFLTSGTSGGAMGSGGADGGSQKARERVSAALADLGPGLGDVVLRCCCFLEGIETTEKTMGWSARSGKIVLRIALQRLKRHYEETNGKYAPMIG